MPNAAMFDDDLGYESKARKGAPRKPRATAAGKKRGAKRKRFGTNQIARFAAIGMAATIATGIMVNALVLQKGHHPAPLFGKTPASTASQASAPLPPVRAMPVRAMPVEASDESAVKGRKTVIGTRETDAPSGDDAIGRLLAGGAAPAAKVASKAQGKGRGDVKDESKTVTGVQRALTKLGFKVPVTGAAGPATKKAIEAYEKDHHLPVKGEVNRRLVKVLAADSGIRMD